jgi:hypothetical protein
VRFLQIKLEQANMNRAFKQTSFTFTLKYAVYQVLGAPLHSFYQTTLTPQLRFLASIINTDISMMTGTEQSQKIAVSMVRIRRQVSQPNETNVHL